MMAESAIAEFGALVPPARDTLQERVYRELKTAIMRGHFAPGRSLTIRAIAAALGTSPMPVREALRQLFIERAIDTLPNRSFGTPLLTRERFSDLLNIRIEVEGYAITKATGRIGEDVIAELDAIELEMFGAEGSGDRQRYIALNHAFHFMIYRASGSEVLIPLIETLWLQVGPYIPNVFAEGTRSAMPHSFHKGIITALRARDGREARKMLVADITTAAKIIQRSAKFAD